MLTIPNIFHVNVLHTCAKNRNVIIEIIRNRCKIVSFKYIIYVKKTVDHKYNGISYLFVTNLFIEHVRMFHYKLIQSIQGVNRYDHIQKYKLYAKLQGNYVKVYVFKTYLGGGSSNKTVTIIIKVCLYTSVMYPFSYAYLSMCHCKEL